MKSINFINPVPPHRAKEVRLWSWLTVVTSCSTLCIIVIYTGIYYSLYRSLSQEKSRLQQKLGSFNKLIEQQRTQKEDLEQLQNKIDLLKKYTTAPKNPVDALNSLHAITGNGLQSIAISKNTFELQVACQNAQHAAICLQKLQRDQRINTVKLTAMQSHNNQIIAIFKGEIT
jgi:hypothetical protein